MKDTSEASFPARRLLVKVLLLAVTAGLLWRAVDLQHTDKAFLKDQGDARHLRVVAIPAHRGKILDRHGDPLAISTPVDSVWADPRELAANADRWPQLAGLLGLDAKRLERVARRGQTEPVRTCTSSGSSGGRGSAFQPASCDHPAPLARRSQPVHRRVADTAPPTSAAHH